MRKLYYIPTSSLNFNSIVASESISPASFYYKRTFGMKRFTDIFEGKWADVTLLADQPALFSRPLSDLEDHPMLIEVYLDEEDVTTLGNGFYSINRTIYITPYNTRFIFFNKQDRLTTESLSDHSLEVKLSHLYIPRMYIENYRSEYDFTQVVIPPTNTYANELTNDDKRNRLKGMLYGYYLGAWLSTNITEVKRLGILLDVQNVFSTAISSGKNKESELRELSKRWEQLFPLYVELKSITPNVDEVLALLKNYRVKLPIENLGLYNYIGFLTEPTKEGETNPAMKWIEERINDHIKNMEQTRKAESLDSEGILTNGDTLMTITCSDEQDIVKHWFNKVLLQESTPVIASWNRMELAEKITDATISFLGNDWGKSQQRAFLNKLRHHIGNGDALDVEWNNKALCSIAAVILHGEEWDKMLRFMQNKGMYDYRLAFAMYGALTGYASMTRDLVDTFCDNISKEYFSLLYKELYGQLHGEDMIPLRQKPIIKQPVEENIPIISSIKEKSPSEKIVDEIKLVAGEKSNRYEAYYCEIISSGLTDWNVIKALTKKKNDGWKGLIDMCKKGKKENSNKIVQPSLFADKLYFYNDNGCWDKIKDLVPPSDANKLRKDLEWFQQQLQKGNSKYYSRVKRESNRDAITIFCKLKDGSFGKEDAKYFPQDLRDKIKQRLLSLYCSND